MELQKQLEHIFNNDYPGTGSFLNEVIKPVFGDDVEIINKNILDTPELRAKANKVGIKSISYVADITDVNLLSDTIALFDVVLNDSCDIERSRVNIQNIIRSVLLTYSHAFILFHYENIKDKSWRLSYAYKQSNIASMTSAKRFTYVFGKNYRGRTAAERFKELAKTKKSDKDLVDAFSVEALSDDFFNRYRAYYAVFVEYITGVDYAKNKDEDLKKIIKEFRWLIKNPDHNQFGETFNYQGKVARDYIKKMFGRIIFLYFLQRKGWLYDKNGKADYRYMHNLFLNAGTLQENFLDDVLDTLFFYILNTDGPEKRKEEAEIDGKDITIIPGWQKISYLNGGLFNKDEIDEKTCVFPAIYFEKFFEFLDSYNFTIDENDVNDAEIGIDPEMLGRIFENLLEDNKDKGAYYTPKSIVDFMCSESIIAYLQEEIKSVVPEKIRELVENLDNEGLTKEQRKEIKDKLKDVTICDPAIGSGAFPMGFLNLLTKLHSALGVDLEKYKVKRHILENNIYGVDIEQGAVDIARLRFWLSMIVDEPNAIPLPNLHFKIMQGNSLLESYKKVDLSKICGDYDKKEAASLDFTGLRKLLKDEIHKYYHTSDHEEGKVILNKIISNVLTQIWVDQNDEDLLKGIKDITANDKFFLWHTWFNEVFEKNGGFDIVIGNPPYLKEGRAPKEIFEPLKVSKYYQGKMDIWYMFACFGLDLLKKNGVLSFIATNNWVTSTGAKKLRNKLVEDAEILMLCDFKDFKIFKTADIQTMIMFFKNSKEKDNYDFQIRNLIGNTWQDVFDMLSLKSEGKYELVNPIFTRKNYRKKFFTFQNNNKVISRLKNLTNKVYLSKTEIGQGIVFPQDFLNKKNLKKLPNHIEGEGIFGLSQNELNNLCLSKIEFNLIRPYYTSQQIKKYYTKPKTNNLWLIYTDSSFKNPNSLNNYPKIKVHLDQFRSIFTSDYRPYGLHRSRNEILFKGEKILCQRKCANHPVFSYNNGDCYVSQTYNLIKTDKVNLKFLTSLLNSSLIEYWLRNMGKIQGLNFQIDSEPLMQIPILKATESQQNKLALLLDSIIDRIEKDPKSDVSDLEKEIDKSVYKLYGLDYDEVLIIDPQTPIIREEYDNFKIDE